jgi:uncharacterized protein YkwD
VRCPTVVAVLVFTALAAAAPATASAASSCAGADSPVEALGSDAAGSVTLCLLNRERTARGRGRLRADARLARAALAHSADMVANRYFAHESRDGSGLGTRIRRTGWTRHHRSYTVGENIAYATGADATPRAIVRAWMHSAGHRANILQRRFRAIGIGIAAGTPDGDGGATYSADFAG